MFFRSNFKAFCSIDCKHLFKFVFLLALHEVEGYISTIIATSIITIIQFPRTGLLFNKKWLFEFRQKNHLLIDYRQETVIIRWVSAVFTSLYWIELFISFFAWVLSEHIFFEIMIIINIFKL